MHTDEHIEAIDGSVFTRDKPLLRGLRKIYHWFIPRTKERVVIRKGVTYSLNYRSVVDFKLIRNGVWEQDQMRYFFLQAKQLNCAIFLDIGAYFGYYSLVAAKYERFSEVHAVEALPEHHERVLRHIQKNNFQDSITPHLAVVSDIKNSVLLESAYGDTKISDSGNVPATTTTLDSLFNFEGKSIAIKMDIEGHEIPALTGGAKLLSRNFVFLQIEVLPNNTQTLDYLYKNGWKLLHYEGVDFFFCNRAIVEEKQNGVLANCIGK